MALLGADVFLKMVRSMRVLSFDGYFGSGKTSLAFRIALELAQSGHCRYILSNCKSPIVDDPETVELRYEKSGAAFVDAVIVLDETGEFIKTSRDTELWLSYLRKLNVILLAPSYRRLPVEFSNFACARVYDWSAWGVPLWQYKYNILQRSVKEDRHFFWHNPKEIWGIYDTEGFPSDGGILRDWLMKWTAKAAESKGYVAPKQTAPIQFLPSSAWAFKPTDQGSEQTENSSMAVLDELRGVAQDLSSAAAQASINLSVHEPQKRKARRF